MFSCGDEPVYHRDEHVSVIPTLHPISTVHITTLLPGIYMYLHLYSVAQEREIEGMLC